MQTLIGGNQEQLYFSDDELITKNWDDHIQDNYSFNEQSQKNIQLKPESQMQEHFIDSSIGQWLTPMESQSCHTEPYSLNDSCYQPYQSNRYQLQDKFVFREPSVDELCLALKIIKEQQPQESNLQETIIALYNSIVLPFQENQQSNNNYDYEATEKLASSLMQRELRREVVDIDPKVIKSLAKRQKIDKIQERAMIRFKNQEFDVNKEEEIKNRQCQKISQIFCMRGYGVCHLKDFYPQASEYSLQRANYKNLMSSALTQTYRNLQNWLQIKYHRVIAPLNKSEVRKVVAKLACCHSWMSYAHLNIFLFMMRKTFNLETRGKIQESQLMELHKILVRIARKDYKGEDRKFGNGKEYRQVLKRVKEMNAGDKWTRDIDVAICEQFRKSGSMHQMKAAIDRAFPQLQLHKANNFSELKSRFAKILRQSIRKLQYEYKKYERESLPVLRVTDYRIRYITREATSKNLRITFSDYYLQENCSKEKLIIIVEQYNYFWELFEEQSKINLKQTEKVEQPRQGLVHNFTSDESEQQLKQSIQKLSYKAVKEKFPTLIDKSNDTVVILESNFENLLRNIVKRWNNHRM